MQLSALTDRDERAFAAHVEDLIESAQDQCLTRFSGFLDDRQLTIAREVARRNEQGVSFFGGYADAQRLMLGAFPFYEAPNPEAFPIVALTISYRAQDPVGHRDILGAALALGIKRETMGDILVDSQFAVCFATEPAAVILCLELDKVGRCGVRVERGITRGLPQAARFEQIDLTVSALRADCMTAALCGISREKAVRMISSALVLRGGRAVGQPSELMEPGDVLSIRGVGKFIFSGVDHITKKGRLAISCKKYM